MPEERRQVERRREPRYPFVAMAEIVDEKERVRSSSRISDLSLHGCYVEMNNPVPAGTNVMIEIYAGEEFVETRATVAFLEARQGMGLQFSELQGYFASILRKWVERASTVKAH